MALGDTPELTSISLTKLYTTSLPFTLTDQSASLYRARQKYPLKFLLIFNNYRDCHTKFYTIVSTYPIISRKPGKFYCIMYRTDKTALLLIVAT